MLREKQIESIISSMTLEEKVRMLSGNGFETEGNKRLGIIPFRMADGPAGVRHGISTAYPSPIALAATWDTSLVYRVGKAIAEEARDKGRNVLLAPCVNILRNPLGGRNFESYGEDPYLAAQMSATFVKGVQSEKVLACVKHFACNNQEWKRHDINVLVSERALREIYLPAFKAAVEEARVGSVMAAYNTVNYAPSTENSHLLKSILKKEWGFEGFVMSDWNATKSTFGSLNSGLDLEMPNPEYFNESIADSVMSGAVDEILIDEKVKRMLRAQYLAGWYDQDSMKNNDTLDHERFDGLALQAARESIVLLKNQKGLLPLDPDNLESIALIGPNTFDARVGGGGSSQVTPRYAVSPIGAVRAILGDKVRISSAYGVAASDDIIPLGTEYMRPYYPYNKSPGLKADYFAGEHLSGVADLTRVDSVIDFVWGYDLPHEKLAVREKDNVFSVRWSGKLIPPITGRYRLNVICNGGCRLFINKELIIDEWDHEPGDNRCSAGYDFESGKEADIVLEYRFEEGIANIKFGWELPDEDLLSAAVFHAKHADAVIVFAGLSNRFESESFDRRQLSLPAQDELIKAVVEVNPNTIVVIQSGSPVMMEKWIRDVPAVLQAWYGGQEGGTAIAEVIFGRFNPTGRLPFTIAWKENDYPALKGYQNPNLIADYHDGIYVGYRHFDKHKVKPLFPFGHGLSYSIIGIGKLLIRKSAGLYNFYATVEMTNMGSVKGTEVLQLYVSALDSQIDRPHKELKHFKRITLEPGERIVTKIPFDRNDFAFFNESINKWQIEPGIYEVMVGTSAGNIKLRKRIEIK